jgi:hypothetical protein
VAEHAFFVTRYAAEIARVMDVVVRPEFLEFCLRHDDDELHSGDIPAPYKRVLRIESNKPSTLTDKEWMIFKAADIIEGILFLIDEQLLGNKTTLPVVLELTNELRRLTQNFQTKGGDWLDSRLMKQIDTHQTYQGRKM